MNLRRIGSWIDRSTVRPTIVLAIAIGVAFAIPHALASVVPTRVDGGTLIDINGPLKVVVPDGWSVERRDESLRVRITKGDIALVAYGRVLGGNPPKLLDWYVRRVMTQASERLVVDASRPIDFKDAYGALEATYRQTIDGRDLQGRLTAVDFGGGIGAVIDAWTPAGSFDAAIPAIDRIARSVHVELELHFE